MKFVCFFFLYFELNCCGCELVMIDEEDLRWFMFCVWLRLLKSLVVGSSEDLDVVVEYEVVGID